MPRVQTVAQLRARAQVLADDENGQLATDAQYLAWLNESFGFVWDQLVMSGIYPKTDEHDITIASTGSGGWSGGTEPRGLEALASDHYALIRVYEVRSADDLRPLEPLHPQDIHKYTRDGGAPSRRYMLWGDGGAVAAGTMAASSIRLYPQPAVGEVYRVIYCTEPHQLVDDDDEVPVYSSWMDRYIVLDTAMKARIKEESGIRDLQAERSIILDQISKSVHLRIMEGLNRPENHWDYGDEVLRDPATRRW